MIESHKIILNVRNSVESRKIFIHVRNSVESHTTLISKWNSNWCRSPYQDSKINMYVVGRILASGLYWELEQGRIQGGGKGEVPHLEL